MNLDVTPEEVFHSLYDARRHFDYTRIEQCVEQGLITISARKIDGPHAQARFDLDKRANRGDLEAIFLTRKPSVHGGDWHNELAAYAEAFLLDLDKKVIFEKAMNGRFPDVASDDWEWIIECGNTDPDPVPKHLLWTCSYFAVLPFQYVEKEWPLLLYVFERGPNWDDNRVKAIIIGDIAARRPNWAPTLKEDRE